MPALVEAVAGSCVGCQHFALLSQISLVPASHCEACMDIDGATADARRADRRTAAPTRPEEILAVYSQVDLDAISHRINTMPRRIHNWRSAADCYHPAAIAATP